MRGYLKMMLDYKEGKWDGQESGKKWLRNKWMLPNHLIRKLLLTNLYFLSLNFFDFMWYLCWVSFKSQVQSLFSDTCNLFSRIFEVFNEIEMEINVIDNKIFTNFFFLNKSMRKRNFIIYHFLVESKPRERIDLLITASMNIYQTKKNW